MGIAYSRSAFAAHHTRAALIRFSKGYSFAQFCYLLFSLLRVCVVILIVLVLISVVVAARRADPPWCSPLDHEEDHVCELVSPMDNFH